MTFSYLCNLICITFANKPGFFLLQICKPYTVRQKNNKKQQLHNQQFVTLSAARLYVGWRSATERSPLQHLLQRQCEFSPVVLWSRDSSALPCPFSASPASGNRRRRIEMKKKKNTKLKKTSKQGSKQTNKLKCCSLRAVYSVCRLHAAAEQMWMCVRVRVRVGARVPLLARLLFLFICPSHTRCTIAAWPADNTCQW